MLDRRHMLLGFGAFILPAADITEAIAQQAASASASQSVGLVAALQGSATARRTGEPRALGSGQTVYTGERLQTAGDSRLHARLGTATQLYMGENTRVMIDNHIVQRGGNIHLGSGALLFERKEPDPKPNVVIRSPYALMAVRGTTVFAGPSNGVFGVFVAQGEVVVTNGGGSVTLRMNEGANIARPGAKPTPPAGWGDARINEAMRSVR